ncbi:hypothetical protein Tco_0104156 [Tanacetum coccineum]
MGRTRSTPVDLTEDEHVPPVNTQELFGPDARPRPPGKERPGKKTKSDTSAINEGSNSSSQFAEFMSHELRLKREATEKAFEVAKAKDRTITRLEELRFLALSTKDLSDDDAYYINLQKEAIKQKYDCKCCRLRTTTTTTTTMTTKPKTMSRFFF